MTRCALSVVLVVGLLVGCSGIKPYPNTLEKNLQIRTETKSGSIFSKVRSAVGIYRVDEQCRIEYQGTVNLDEPLVPVGIPADRLSYLVFAFASSSLLANARSTISQETLLKPRAGYSYLIAVSYQDDIYNVIVREDHPRKGISREIELQGLDACREQLEAKATTAAGASR